MKLTDTHKVMIFCAILAGLFGLFKYGSVMSETNTASGNGVVAKDNAVVPSANAPHSPGAIVTTVAPVQNNLNSPNSSQTVNIGPIKRQLSPEQRTQIKTMLSPFAGSKIIIGSLIGDAETQGFAREIESAIKDAGWVIVGESSTHYMGGTPAPLMLELPKSEFSEARWKQLLDGTPPVNVQFNELPAVDVALVNAIQLLKLKYELRPTMGDSVKLTVGSAE